MTPFELYEDTSSSRNLQSKEFAILQMIAEHKSCSATDLIDLIARSSERIPRAVTIYKLVNDLESKRLILSSEVRRRDSGGRPYRVFHVTDVGYRVLEIFKELFE